MSEAHERVTAFVDAWESCRGLDPEVIHGINGENELRVSDLRALLSTNAVLLEALKRCRFDSLNMTLNDLKFCRAAFAKATGA